MTLWHLMLALCVANSVAGAFGAALSVSSGAAGLIVAFVVGVAAGLVCAALMRALGARVADRAMKSEAFAGGLYAGAVVWIITAFFVGEGVMRVILPAL